VCASHTHVLYEWKDLCFTVEVMYGCGFGTACGNAKCSVLCSL